MKKLVWLLWIIFLLTGPSCLYAQSNLCESTPAVSKQKLNGFPAKKDVLANSALFAVFSAISYTNNGLGMYKLPRGWYRDISKSDPSGLFIATFKNSVKKELVIAFRGTEPDKLTDWAHNLLPIIKPQSRPALKFTKEFIADNPGWSVILTGHSLGGGLAIEMSHKLKTVSVVAFNPSPRIGMQRNGYQNKRIVVREKHEPLAIVRGNPSVREGWQLTYEALVDFSPGFFGQKLLAQHSIGGMALNLLALTSTWSEESKELYELTCNAQQDN